MQLEVDSGRQKPHLYSTTRDHKSMRKNRRHPSSAQSAHEKRSTLHSRLGCESCGRAVHSPPECRHSHPFFSARCSLPYHASRTPAGPPPPPRLSQTADDPRGALIRPCALPNLKKACPAHEELASVDLIWVDVVEAFRCRSHAPRSRSRPGRRCRRPASPRRCSHAA